MARPVSQGVQHRLNRERQTGGFLVELETEVLNWLDFFFLKDLQNQAACTSSAEETFRQHSGLTRLVLF